MDSLRTEAGTADPTQHMVTPQVARDVRINATETKRATSFPSRRIWSRFKKFPFSTLVFVASVVLNVALLARPFGCEGRTSGESCGKSYSPVEEQMAYARDTYENVTVFRGDGSRVGVFAESAGCTEVQCLPLEVSTVCSCGGRTLTTGWRGLVKRQPQSTYLPPTAPQNRELFSSHTKLTLEGCTGALGWSGNIKNVGRGNLFLVGRVDKAISFADTYVSTTEQGDTCWYWDSVLREVDPAFEVRQDPDTFCTAPWSPMSGISNKLQVSPQVLGEADCDNDPSGEWNCEIEAQASPDSYYEVQPDVGLNDCSGVVADAEVTYAIALRRALDNGYSFWVAVGYAYQFTYVWGVRWTL